MIQNLFDPRLRRTYRHYCPVRYFETGSAPVTDPFFQIAEPLEFIELIVFGSRHESVRLESFSSQRLVGRLTIFSCHRYDRSSCSAWVRNSVSVNLDSHRSSMLRKSCFAVFDGDDKSLMAFSLALITKMGDLSFFIFSVLPLLSEGDRRVVGFASIGWSSKLVAFFRTPFWWRELCSGISSF